MNGLNYLNFLQNELPALIENSNLSEEVRHRIIFMHDGAPAHYTRFVRDHLNAVYGDDWIGRGGPITWPPRSPDLNPCDFFLWGYIKNIVYRGADTHNEEEIRARIDAAFASIDPVMISRTTRNILRRAQACVDVNGQHFEQNLH